MSHQQLTLEQRYHIQSKLEVGASYKIISDAIGFHKSTVSREVARLGRSRYSAEEAHQQAMLLRHQAEKYTKQTEQAETMVKQLLCKGLSPEAIANRTKLERGEAIASHETIYRWLLLDKDNGGELYKHLLRVSKPYRKRYGSKHRRGKIQNRVGIEERPEIVEARTRLGDWEGDTVHGKNGNIVTVIDRTSRYYEARLIGRRTKEAVTQKMISILNNHESCHTLTLDNGVEFHGHQEIAKKSNVDVFFADPYSSYQRGSNENGNGILRRFLPKKSDFSKVTPQRLRRIIEKINNRPMKVLGWKTPYEVHFGVSVAFIP